MKDEIRIHAMITEQLKKQRNPTCGIYPSNSLSFFIFHFSKTQSDSEYSPYPLAVMIICNLTLITRVIYEKILRPQRKMTLSPP